MSRSIKIPIIGLACGLAIGLVSQASALSVTPFTTAGDLATTIVGSGITTSSIVYTGAELASGTFSGGLASGIGIESGIILTTGNASLAVGPNSGDATTGNNGLGGDADLNLIIGNTLDATVLEFDFESDGGDLFFNFVFASEEYNEFSNTEFNDAFAFFLDGTNIALLDDGVTPVSINTVNGGNPFGSGAINPDLFNNNDLGDGGPFFDLEYDGFTDVFTAKALGLAAGMHHIKLAIADVADHAFDSAVFIQASSFSDTPTQAQIVPLPGAMGAGLMVLGSLGAARIARRKKMA